MKKIFAVAILAMLGLVGKPQAAFITNSISSTALVNNFAASGVLLLQARESMDYSMVGPATGTIHLEKSLDGVNYNVILTSVCAGGSATLSGTQYAGEIPAFFRFRVSTQTAGTFVTTLVDDDDFVGELRNNKKVASVTFTDERVIVPKLTYAPTGDTAIILGATHTFTNYTFPNSFVIVTSTGGPLVMSATPTISTTTARTGDIYIIQSTTATITLSDNDTVAGTLLELGSTTRALGVGDILAVIYRAGKWWELYFANN